MGNSVLSQALLFAASLLFSFIIGAEYDFFRTLRIVFHPGTVAVFIQDVIFFLLCAVQFTFFCFFFADGEIRLFVVLTCVVGTSLYCLTVGKFFCEKIKETLLKFRKRRESRQSASVKESENENS